MTHDIPTLVKMNTAIASVIHEQSTVASKVNKYVLEIREIAKSAGQISNQNAEMIKELSCQVTVLNNEVNQFKV